MVLLLSPRHLGHASMYLLSTEVILNDQNTAEIIEFAAPASRLPSMRNCPTLNFDTRGIKVCNCGMIWR